jgi:hypothetical protein
VRHLRFATRQTPMRRRYYFDTNDGHLFVRDDMGQEFDSLQEVQIEAARNLAELARDVVRGGEIRTLSFEVRDRLGVALRTSLGFEVEHARPNLKF